MFDSILVALIVTVAGLYLLRRRLRKPKPGADGQCSCSGCSCSASREIPPYRAQAPR